MKKSRKSVARSVKSAKTAKTAKSAKKKAPAKPRAPKLAAKTKKSRSPTAAPQPVTPYLTVKGAAEAITFYQAAFRARMVVDPFVDPSGRVDHAQLQIGGATIMLTEEKGGRGMASPVTHGGTAVTLYVYVDDVDELFERATASGAMVVFAPTDQFWGDRTGRLRDPFGHQWQFATRVRDVPLEEMRRAHAEMQQRSEASSVAAAGAGELAASSISTPSGSSGEPGVDDSSLDSD